MLLIIRISSLINHSSTITVKAKSFIELQSFVTKFINYLWKMFIVAPSVTEPHYWSN